jgi:hypothetical protein
MVRNTFAIALILFFAVPARCVAQAVGARLIESEGGFSFCPPAGWTAKQLPGMKYRIAYGSPVDGFAPNVNAVDEQFVGTLEAYVDNSIKALPSLYERAGMKNFRNLSKSEFTTVDNERGFKVVIESEMNGRAVRQTFCVFAGKGDTKLLLTYSVPARGGELFDRLVEESARTFKIESEATK